MKKKYSLFIILIIYIYGLTACSKQHEEISQRESFEQTDTIIPGITVDHIQKELDTAIYVDAKVEKPNSSIVVPYDMEWYSVPVEDITRLLIESNGDSVLDSTWYENEIYKSITTIIETGNGSNLFISYGELSFESTRGRAYKEICNFGKILDNEYVVGSGTLPFASSEEAVRQIDEILDAVGIANNFNIEYSVLAFDHLTLKNEQNRLLVEDEAYKDFFEMGKIKTIEQWSEDDDIYYFRISFNLNDIPFIDKPFGFLDERIMREFSGEGIVSKRGIERLYLEGIPKINIEKNEERIISLDTLFEKIKLKFNDIILSEPITITNIRLVYFPIPDISNQGKAELRPVWEVTSQSLVNKRGREQFIIQNFYWDGITGEEIR